MKQMFAILLVTLVGLQAKAQQKEISYGSVRYDGYEAITKGAFWTKRPEAKLVFEGSNPPGVQVYVLEADYIVRFVDAEHNSHDGNYIIFPKGSIVYTKNGKWYAAKCGNEIEYISPLEKVKIIDKPADPPQPPPCENKLSVMIHRKVDQNKNLISESRDTVGTMTSGCKNTYTTSIDTIFTAPSGPTGPSGPDNLSTGGTYNHGAFRGGPRPDPNDEYTVVRQKMFWITVNGNGRRRTQNNNYGSRYDQNNQYQQRFDQNKKGLRFDQN